MSGWTILYGLINFAILAVGLYLIGKKIVVNLYKEHRAGVEKDIASADEARAEAGRLREAAPAEKERAALEGEEILRSARSEAEKNSLSAEEADRAAAARLEEKSAEALRLLRADTRRRVSRETAHEITSAAAELLRDESNAREEKALRARLLSEITGNMKLSNAELDDFERNGTAPVKVRFARTPEETEVLLVTETVEKILRDAHLDSVRTEVTEEVDPGIIGGVFVQVGNTVFDGSLAGMLRRAEEEIAGAEKEDGDLLAAFRDRLSGITSTLDVFQIGRVASVSDGICNVTGLSDAMAGELLVFGKGLRGMVMDLKEGSVGVALLGDYDELREGDTVLRTRSVTKVPVGEAMLGRVVDALGRPVDGKDEIRAEEMRPIESPAPGVIDRCPVSVPMMTGIKAIDALIPIGRGQRELIIGDRQTGKTAIAVDTIINQRGKDMICIYVAIGQKESTVASVADVLDRHGAMDYTVIVCANASEPAPMLYIAPYAGAAIGEYFMYQGRDVLIVYDDLSKHAVAYREISLLLHRPPGREAYPGDVFYLHSRLLERAARLNETAGGGSMTAMPIIETQAGNIAAYIPTNVISITDGQIFLETDLFNAGVRPAVDVGLSVSRVGGAAQLGAMKQVAAHLRMDLAQYRELKNFAQFGSDLDKSTRATLLRGDRMTELLKQGQYEPLSAADQVVAIFAAAEGFCDGIEGSNVARYETGLRACVKNDLPAFAGWVDSGKKLSDEQREELRACVARYTEAFR